MNQRNVTLRIKRKYLEAIASGEKRVEYRSASAFNERLLSKGCDTLTLHFQTKRKLVCRVRSVDLIELDAQTKFFAIYIDEVIRDEGR